MKITGVETIPVAYPEPNDAGATRHLLFVRITGEDGQVGWGEAVTMWPEATRATAVLVDALAPIVVGREPGEHARIHQELQRHTWWYGNGGLAAFAVAALDIALWDLAGKQAGLSVLDLLGGPVHDRMPALISCHATEGDLDAMAATMAHWVSDQNAVGIKVGFGKRGDARLGTDMERDVAFVAALRRELGPDRSIMIDIGAAIDWDPPTAIHRTRAFEEFGIDWIEEPLGADNPVGYAELRAHHHHKNRVWRTGMDSPWHPAHPRHRYCRCRRRGPGPLRGHHRLAGSRSPLQRGRQRDQRTRLVQCHRLCRKPRPVVCLPPLPAVRDQATRQPDATRVGTGSGDAGQGHVLPAHGTRTRNRGARERPRQVPDRALSNLAAHVRSGWRARSRRLDATTRGAGSRRR